MTYASLWRLFGFGEKLDDWKRLENPTDHIVRAVIRWSLTRLDDPYVGVRREPGFPNLWFGGIPATIDGDRVVACSYWVLDAEHMVRCESYATLSMPL